MPIDTKDIVWDDKPAEAKPDDNGIVWDTTPSQTTVGKDGISWDSAPVVHDVPPVFMPPSQPVAADATGASLFPQHIYPFSNKKSLR